MWGKKIEKWWRDKFELYTQVALLFPGYVKDNFPTV